MENVPADVTSAPASLGGVEKIAPVMKTLRNVSPPMMAMNVPEMETVPVARARVVTCLAPVNNISADIVRLFLAAVCAKRWRNVSTVKHSILIIVLRIASSNWIIWRTTLSTSRVTILRSNLPAPHGLVIVNTRIQVNSLIFQEFI